MHAINKRLCIFFISFSVLSLQSLHANVFEADKFFAQQNYQEALKAYSRAAKLGNAHAYFRLGRMHLHGLGVKQDGINALIYFSLAAEYDFLDAQERVDKLLAKFSESDRRNIEAILKEAQINLGKQLITEQYYPLIDKDSLLSKVTFEGKDSVNTRFETSVLDEQDFDLDFGNSFGSLEDNDFDNNDSLPMNSQVMPYIIVDADINKDGSIRAVHEVQVIGSNADLFIEDFLGVPVKIPTIDGQAVEFVERFLMGSATLKRISFIEEDESLYSQILRLSRQLKKSEVSNDQYQYAMALLNFPWLKQEDGEAMSLLLKLAQNGHPGAMFEYGLALYREQKNIDESIDWISRAASYGLARAEFRLGKILQSSPWVINDESKAIFWFESAAKKDYSAASIAAANIRLLATSEELLDVEKAIKHLDKVSKTENKNPEYFYLLALSHKDRPDRNFVSVVQNLEKAIDLGNRYNWDTQAWQDLLERLTQGDVNIIEES